MRWVAPRRALHHMREAKYAGAQRGSLELQTPVGTGTVPGPFDQELPGMGCSVPRYRLRREWECI